MTYNEQSQSNLDSAIKFIDMVKSDRRELNDVETDICITFAYELFNDITIRRMDFTDCHFRLLSARFDDICEDYQARGIANTQLDNALVFCRAIVDATIKTFAKEDPSAVERIKLDKRYTQLNYFWSKKN